jgi:hypothetical protein
METVMVSGAHSIIYSTNLDADPLSSAMYSTCRTSM